MEMLKKKSISFFQPTDEKLFTESKIIRVIQNGFMYCCRPIKRDKKDNYVKNYV